MAEGVITRKTVRIALEQLVWLQRRPPDEFFTDWRCQLCPYHAGATDRDTALNDAATHLHEHHGAQGGHYSKRGKGSK